MNEFLNEHDLMSNLSIKELRWILNEIRISQTKFLKYIKMGGEKFREYIREDVQELPLFLVDSIIYFCGSSERFKHLRVKYAALTAFRL